MAWDTAANVLNDAALELGLVTAEVADPYGETGQHWVQLRQLLKAVGQDLARDFAWSHLQTAYTFPTANGQAAYALPSDFSRLVDGTCWNRTQARRLSGPVNAQEWEALQGGAVSGLLDKAFRLYGGNFNLYPTPTAAETLAYEYVSANWVSETGQTSPTSEAPDEASDILYLERRLLVCALKLAFLRQKGFPSDAAQDDFERALARAQGGDGAAAELRVGGGSVFPLGRFNVPDTGYGQ